MAARSTTHGTPVKSCSTTRAGMKGISPRLAVRGLHAGELPHVRVGHEAAAGVAERVLQQDADGEREAVEVGEPLAGQLGEAVDDRGLVAEGKGGAGAERVGGVNRHGRRG